MNRDSGSENPGQRTVADLLQEYGGDSTGSQRGDRRRRRRSEDTTETAPHAIIDRVLSDSGQLRAIRPGDEPPQTGRAAPHPQAAPGQAAGGQAGGGQAGGGQDNPQQAGSRPSPTPRPQSGPQPAPHPQATQASADPTQPPQVQAPAAQQPQVQQAAAQPQGAVEGVTNAPVGAEGANFWAQRFAAAGAPAKSPAQQPEQHPAAQSPQQGDADRTVQQQPMRPQPHPRVQQGTAVPAGQEQTEKLPPLRAQQAQQQQAVGSGTALFAQSPMSAPGPATGEEVDDFDDEDFPDEAYDFGDSAGFDRADRDDLGADEPFDEQDSPRSRPAGLPPALGDEDADEDTSPGREWMGQVAQGVVGLLCGAVVTFGFSWLWMKSSLAAFVAALVVTGCLVLLARKLRGDDLQTTLLAVLAGLFCTVSPVALLMLDQ